MKKLLLLISVFFLFSFGSNISKKKPIEIKIDVNSSLEFKIRDNLKDALILTKNNKPYLLDGVANLLTLSDGYIIYDRNKEITKFNLKGKFVTSIPYESKINRSNNIDVSVKNDSIFIFDLICHQVLIYDRNGNFINKKSTKQKNEKNSFSTLLPFKNQYIGIKLSQINDMKTGLSKSEFGIYNSNFEYIMNVDNPQLIESNTQLCTITSKGEVLWVDLFTCDIFSMNKAEIIEKKYTINFLKHSLPKNYITRDNLSEVLNEKKWCYVMGVYVLSESDNYLIFHYGYGEKIHFAIYDKKNNKTHSFRIADSNISSNKTIMFDYMVQNLIVKDDVIIFYLQSYKNITISKVKIKDIIL